MNVCGCLQEENSIPADIMTLISFGNDPRSATSVMDAGSTSCQLHMNGYFPVKVFSIPGPGSKQGGTDEAGRPVLSMSRMFLLLWTRLAPALLALNLWLQEPP